MMATIITSVQHSTGEIGRYHKMEKKWSTNTWEKNIRVSSFASAMIIHRTNQPNVLLYYNNLTEDVKL